MKTKKATLESGQEIEYLPEVIGEGGMKVVHFTPDRSSVVCFFKDKEAASDPERRRRLQYILGRFNPTTNPENGHFWKNLYCWPTGIVVKPELGVVAPAYPKNFFFGSGQFKGQEKKSNWFTSPKLRRLLPEAEKGDWLRYLQICIRVARAIRRMHNAGLAHSDLSNNNVLVDPTTGGAVVIDIDSLVVPQLFPPDVLGTPGYIAPEVLATKDLDLDDPKRVLPSRATDLYALPVLIYEYLLNRHPLHGPKRHSTNSAEEDEYLLMGPNALWIEDPNDTSNRPRNLKVPVSALGPYLADLFKEAFVDGLHHPDNRPVASRWEQALVKTTDLLLPCRSSSCEHKWFVFGGTRPLCPFCGTAFQGTMPVLNFYRERKSGQFVSEKHRLVVWQNQRLYRWHVYDNASTGESAERTPLGYFTLHNGRWYLVNQNSESMSILNSGPVPVGGHVELQEGTRIHLSKKPHGRLAVVQIVRT